MSTVITNTWKCLTRFTIHRTTRSYATTGKTVHYRRKAGRYTIEAGVLGSLPEGQRVKILIIQEALRSVLEKIYEPQFTEYSHGYRPSRGTHSALCEVRRWIGVTWFIRFKLKKVDERDAAQNVTNVLKEQIDDPRFYKLLEDMFDGGALRLELGGSHWDKGMLHCGHLAAVLCNIHLHQLDLVVKKIVAETGRVREQNVMNKHQHGAAFSVSDCPRNDISDMTVYKEEDAPDVSRTKLWYVRYVDELLAGYRGDKDGFIVAWNTIANYLEGNLSVPLDRFRSRISHSYQNRIEFLGFEIQCQERELLIKKGSKHLEHAKRTIKRVKGLHKVRLERITKTYEIGARKAIAKALQEAHVKGGQKGYQDTFNQITASLRDVLKEGMQKNFQLQRVGSPTDILLNEWTQRALPSEITSAAARFDEEIRKFSDVVTKADDKVKSTGEVDIDLQDTSKGKRKVVQVKAKLPPYLNAPLKQIRDRLAKAGFLKLGRPRHNVWMLQMDDAEIVSRYARLALAILSYYRCSSNFDRIRIVADYHLRYSCLHTLASKHQKSLAKTIDKYGKDLLIDSSCQSGTNFIAFPSRSTVLSTRRGFSVQDNPLSPWDLWELMYRLLKPANA